MAVNRACYCTREDVMSSPDIKLTPDMIRHVDSGIEAAVDDIDRLCKRRFWNAIETNVWDWPNFQRSYPWRIWLDAKEIADRDGTGPLGVAPVIKTGVQSSSPQVIPNSAIFWQPRNYGPPWFGIEISRATSYSFGLSNTPQLDVSIQAVYGYWTQTKLGGTLSAVVSDTTGTSITVSDGAVVGVGDVINIDTEALLIRDRAMTDTSQAQQSGCTTAESSDDVLTVTDGTKYFVDEVLQLDAEWLHVLSITGNKLTVERAYNGTVLDTHSSAEIYAQRLLTVQRGFGGSTATTHTNSTVITVDIVPSHVRELAIAESLNYVYQKTSAYARTIGENTKIVPGGSLPDLRSRVYEAYGRKMRQRVV